MRKTAACVAAGFPGSWEDEQFCYLTTTGRVTGRAHEIETWFGLQGGLLFSISGRGEDADWVKNLRRAPKVTVRVGNDTKDATARVVQDGGAHAARRVLAAKYRGWQEGRPLSGWAAEALLVEVVPEEATVHENERGDDA